MAKKIGYARVSTQDQSPSLQIDALRKAGCDEIYQEAQPGDSSNRPQLSSALERLQAGDTLVVWKLDRLARSISQLISTLESLEMRGVQFRSLTEAVDTTNASGKLLFHLFGALAEFERSLIRERTVAGLAAARERGRVGGRPRALSAERRNELIRERRQNPSISVAQLAQQYGTSPSTTYRCLRVS